MSAQRSDDRGGRRPVARRARWPGCWSPTSPASWPGRTPRCCWPTSAPRWSRSRARPATTPAPGCRRSATGSRPTTSGVNRNKRSIALDLKDADDLAAAPRAGPPGRRGDRELPARRAGPVRPGLRHRRGDQPAASSTPRSAASAAARRAPTLPGYDLIVQAISGLMSLTGDPDGPPYRAGISVFDVMAGLHATIGILAALHHRARDRPRPARRGQPAVLGAVRAGQPRPARTSPAASVPVPDGQQPPEPVPVRAAALRRRRPDHHRRQRRPVPQARARCSACPSWPTTRASPATRTAPPTATSCGRCWSSGCATRTTQEWFDDDHRRRRAVRPDQHHRRRRRVRRGASASTRWSTSVRATRRCPSARNPITLLRDAGALPTAAAGARRARRRDPRLAGRGATHERRSSSSRPRWAPPTPTRSGCSART